MLTWWQKISLKLFRPQPPRPAEGEASPAEIARIIVELIQAADRANGTLGKDQLVSFMQHLSGAAPEWSLTRLGDGDFFSIQKPHRLRRILDFGSRKITKDQLASSWRATIAMRASFSLAG